MSVSRTARRVALPGVDLALDDWGPPDSPAVLCLHGFPELGRYWQPLAARLPAWRWLMPDLRGCGASGRAADPDDYGREALVGDVLALLDALALPRVHLVGHDFGGVLAWWVAEQAPQRLSSLAVFNAPHPEALQARLLHDPAQRTASAYIPRLKQPGAASALLVDGAAALWARLRPADGALFDAEDRDAWLRAWSTPEALEGALAWYRCFALRLPQEPEAPRPYRPATTLDVLTLIAWGDADATFVPALAEDSLAHCRHGRLLRLPGVGHHPPRAATAACAEALHELLVRTETAIDQSSNRSNA